MHNFNRGDEVRLNRESNGFFAGTTGVVTYIASDLEDGEFDYIHIVFPHGSGIKVFPNAIDKV